MSLYEVSPPTVLVIRFVKELFPDHGHGEKEGFSLQEKK